MDHSLRVQKSIEYIESNLSGNLSLDALAKTAYLSKYYYHRLFHKAVGESVNRYISRKRMECAAKDLKETELPIIDIALKYQYGSQEAFSRAFKKAFELTPGKYRQLYAGSKQIAVCQLHSRSCQITNIAA